MATPTNWYISKFPESLYQISPSNKESYVNRVLKGKKIMSESTCCICGLARDIQKTLPFTIARIERLGQMFKDYAVIVYENDSEDGTVFYLNRWASENPRVFIESEVLNKPKHGSVDTHERTVDMAECRNKLLNIALKTDSFIQNNDHKFDYVFMLDMDLEGGYSYEGICNSIGWNDFDGIGSNGIFYRIVEHEGKEVNQRLFYDAWAFRRLGHDKPHAHEEINILRYERGEEPFEVISNHNGMTIYKADCLRIPGLKYKAGDCDHVTLNKQLREHGKKICLNPSQITLYNKHGYVI
jgi:hypothetical protein